MRYLGTIASLLILAFWVTMNSLVVSREWQRRSLDKYRAGIATFLGTDLIRERWMGVYKKNRKIGYTGYTFEKVLAEEGVEILSTMDSRIELEVLGRPVLVGIHGILVLNDDLLPLRLRLEVDLESLGRLTVTGEPRGGQFLVTVRQQSQTYFRIPLPRQELCLGDGLVPNVPLAGFKVGETYTLSCFDPMTMSRSPVEMKVVSAKVQAVDGQDAEVFTLETTFRGVVSRARVTGAGLILTQELGPPFQDIVLRRELSKESARRLIKSKPDKIEKLDSVEEPAAPAHEEPFPAAGRQPEGPR